MRVWLGQCSIPTKTSNFQLYCLLLLHCLLLLQPKLNFQRVSGTTVYPVCCDYLLSIHHFQTKSSNRKVTSCWFYPQTIHNVMGDKYSHCTDRYIYLRAEMQYYKFCILIFLSLNDFYEHTVLFNTCLWLVIEKCLIQEMDLTFPFRYTKFKKNTI